MDFLRSTLGGLISRRERTSDVVPLQVCEDRLARVEEELASLSSRRTQQEVLPAVHTQTGRSTSGLQVNLVAFLELLPLQRLLAWCKSTTI